MSEDYYKTKSQCALALFIFWVIPSLAIAFYISDIKLCNNMAICVIMSLVMTCVGLILLLTILYILCLLCVCLLNLDFGDYEELPAAAELPTDML